MLKKTVIHCYGYLKKRTTVQTLKAILSYIVTLEELYKNSIKVINKEKEVETNGKDN